MTIIFDFNRTIYDPESRSLVPYAAELLAELSGKGAVLHLVSMIEADRADILESLGIARYFTSTAFVSDKEDAMRSIAANSGEPLYVVGDHLHGEIRIGNMIGAKTVWLRRGRFSSLEPLLPHDRPWRTATDMKQVRAALFE